MSKSIMQPTEPKYCYVCGRQYNLERHHIYAGVANRKLSEKYGLWVYLCHECHTGSNGAQYTKNLGDRLKREGQAKFEQTHAREEFRAIFGKSYL